jgi:hypothetical protein
MALQQRQLLLLYVVVFLYSTSFMAQVRVLRGCVQRHTSRSHSALHCVCPHSRNCVSHVCHTLCYAVLLLFSLGPQAPLLPYMVKQLGADASYYGLLQSSFSALQLAGGLLSGGERVKQHAFCQFASRSG